LPFRAVSRIALGIGVLAFVLPFASVSCGGHELFTARGVDAVIGGQYTVGGQVNYYSGDPYFLVAVVGAILALAFLFLRRYSRVSLIASGLAGLGSVAGMMIAQRHVNSQIADLHSNGVVNVRWDIGYSISLFAFGAGTLLTAVEVVRVVRERPVPGSSGATTTPALRATIAGVIAMVASLIIIAACAIPYMHYSMNTTGPSFDWTYSPSVFAPGSGPSNWFAAEPIGVALLAFIAGAALIELTGAIPVAIAVGVLLAYGAQTVLLFVGYIALAIGSPDAQLRPGGIVGAFGGVLLLAGGLVALNLSRKTRLQALGLVRAWSSRSTPGVKHTESESR
jgi:hypothetical protein